MSRIRDSVLQSASTESAEVRYATNTVVLIDAGDVLRLKDAAANNPRRRIRLCAHSGVENPVHEMLIVHARDTYVRPHKHLAKSESFHVVDGDVDIVLFDDEGRVRDVIQMGAYQSGRPFFYRIAEPIFHTLLIRSEQLVFHETTGGPFRRADTVFAPWAPEDGNQAAVTRFLSELESAIGGWGATLTK